MRPGPDPVAAARTFRRPCLRTPHLTDYSDSGDGAAGPAPSDPMRSCRLSGSDRGTGAATTEHTEGCE